MKRILFRVRFLSLVVFAMFAGVWPMAAQAATATVPSLGAAAGFSVLAGKALTCTDSTVTGPVGVTFPLIQVASTGCQMQVQRVAVATDPGPYKDFRAAYTAGLGTCGTPHLGTTLPDGKNLGPGTYCVDAALTLTTQTLNLTGTTGPWNFEIAAGLSATNSKVVMVDGGNPCDVFWWVGADVTFTTSTSFQGTILGGGDITLTTTSLKGRALATGAVSMTSSNIFGCNAGGIVQCDQGASKDEDANSAEDEDAGSAEAARKDSARHDDDDASGTAVCDTDDSNKDNKTEDNKTEDNKTDGNKTEDNKTEDHKTEGNKTEGNKTEGNSNQGNSSQGNSSKADTTKADTSKAETGNAETIKTVTTKADTSKAATTQANTTKANTTKANATKANATKANTTKANTTKANATKANATHSNDSRDGGGSGSQGG
jgi:uncharacterized protein YjbI with pentapeptide repeats